MARNLTIRQPTVQETHLLETFLEEEHPPQIHRRAQAILYYGLGCDGLTIAKALRVHPNTIYSDLHAFACEGLGCLRPLPVGGTPSRITAEHLAQVWEWAERPPRDFGLLDARWTLASFREFLVKRQRLLKRISLEHLRQLLKKRTFAFSVSNANCSARIRNARSFWPVFVGCFSTCRRTESWSFSM